MNKTLNNLFVVENLNSFFFSESVGFGRWEQIVGGGGPALTIQDPEVNQLPTPKIRKLSKKRGRQVHTQAIPIREKDAGERNGCDLGAVVTSKEVGEQC